MFAGRIAAVARRESLRPTLPFLVRRPLAVLPVPRGTTRGYAFKIEKVPQMAESISEGTLKQFNKKVGEFVEQDEEIATIETDKIDVAVNASEAGTIKEYYASEEDTVTVGQDLVRIELGGSPNVGEKKDVSSNESKFEPARIESTAELDKSQSVAPQKSELPRTPEPEQPMKVMSMALPDVQNNSSSLPASPPPMREERRIKMNRMRLRIAERLKQSQNTAASLTTFNEVDMSNMMEFRKLYKDDILKKTGIKLGFMSAFARATVLAIRDIPAVNASIEGPNGGDTVVYRDYVDISVAVATEKGLVTPVVRNVESMDMLAIEKSIADMGKKACTLMPPVDP
ncbi:dihydrolipoamide succinyltransferase [Drechmeria coniospora]|uniref:Dihydrolipoamide acetyltransferase component of pyruvate dehydrogenase complex n=1 Tax=Drechmeria coniospora TaxID=98403 RepID=A0A151GI00_DRECN|nr:dihydrolipoamide succinyltransferase [Drechmeria coniospora]KYK56710.1 dihydrolipoamide succinyltransferase [Drechmeria coniospora]